MKLQTLGPGLPAVFLVSNPRRGFSLSCGFAASGDSESVWSCADCIASDCTTCAPEVQQVVRVVEHRLRNGSAAHCARHCTHAARRECADCARHCEQVAQRKSSASFAAVRTVCTRIVCDIVRVCGFPCGADSARDCERICTTEIDG